MFIRRNRLLAGLFGGAALAGLVFPTVAMAAAGGTGHTFTLTETTHGTFTDDEASNPCTGEPGTATFEGNMVSHVTLFPAGDEIWGTFTETGKVTVTWGGVDYSGHATAWGNININERNQNSTFTLTVRVFAADGSSVLGHDVAHFTMNANGDLVVSFDKATFTCS